MRGHFLSSKGESDDAGAKFFCAAANMSVKFGVSTQRRRIKDAKQRGMSAALG